MSALTRLKQQWNTQDGGLDAGAFDAQWLEKTIDIVNELYDEMGSLGTEFKAAVQDVKATERFNPALKATWAAYFVAFLVSTGPVDQRTGFANRVEYKNGAIEDYIDFIGTRFHEFIHAIQHDKHPITHAVPINQKSVAILLPTDYIRLKVLMELDAYSKEAWLMSKFYDAFEDEMDEAALPWKVQLYRTIAAQDPARSDALNMAMFAGTLLRHKQTTQNGEKVAYMDDYHTSALDQYLISIQNWQHRTEQAQEPEACMLTREDIIALGDTFGPNVFTAGRKDELVALFLEPPVLSAENKHKLGAVYEMFGIESEEDAQPEPLAQILSAKGMTMDAFMADSKSGIPAQLDENGDYIRPNTRKLQP